MMSKGKGLGFKWFNFLYGWFVFRIIVDTLGTLSNFGQLKSYETMYGSLYGINELIYWIIFSTIVSTILKLIALLTKRKASGYVAINIVLAWDIMHWFVWGLQYDLLGAIFAPLLMSAFIIPSFFYLEKRKFIYSTNNNGNVKIPIEPSLLRCELCGKEDANLICSEIVDDLGTKYLNLCETCSEKYNKQTIEKKDDTNTISKPETEFEKICFCRKCGSELLNNSAFCSKCGTEVIK